jgi:[ribosomal protein S5]-alanine N-acetyltransferase
MAQHTIPILQSPRLILRPLSIEDAAAIQRHFNNWEIIRHLSKKVPWPYPDDGAERYIADVLLPGIEQGGLMVWTINKKEAPVDAIGLLEFRLGKYAILNDLIDNRGFWLAKEHQGLGLMTEVAFAFQDYIFFELGIEKIVVHNAKTNQSSRRIKQKTGARYLGIVEMEHHEGGKESEEWEITRDSWTAFRNTK